MKRYSLLVVMAIVGLHTYGLSNPSVQNLQSYRIIRAEGVAATRGSGDNQHGVSGRELSRPFTAKVVDTLGNPIEGVRVFFQVAQAPKGESGHTLSPISQLTDSLGLASTSFKLGYKTGEYKVSASIRTSNLESFVIFTAFAKAPNWLVMLIVGLLGGLALFFMGMNLMSSGLKHSTGHRIRSILGKLTRNRVYATGFGALITAITQSSSATSVMLVGFVQSGLLQFRQTIGMIFGAAIGTTVTVQLIAFNLADYSLLIIALGFALQVMGKHSTVRFAGEALLGFGILFFGMHIMSGAMSPLRSYEPFINVLSTLEQPLLGILVGTLFTALIQSSSAFVGIMITLASQGLISLEASIPLLLGANLGTTVTGNIAAARASREAKKVAVAYTIFKLIGILLMVGFIQQFAHLIKFITPEQAAESTSAFADNTPRLIANAHTVFNVIIALAILPFTNTYDRFIEWLVPRARKRKPEFEVLYLDRNLLNTPPVALKLAKKEVERLFDMVQQMVDEVLVPFVAKSDKPLAQLERLERNVDFLRDQINSYLLKLTRMNITEKSIQEAFLIMYAAKELEQIADLVSGNLLERARWWLGNTYEFSAEGMAELKEFHALTQKQIKRSREIFAELDLEKAKRMARKYEEYKNIGRELERQHFARLSEDVNQSVTSSKTHLELVSMFRTIGSHANNIAQVMLGWGSEDVAQG